MATRSRIGLLIGDESVVSVYHHWDGYPDWLGTTLRQKYNTKEKIEELLDGGDISCIDSDTDWDRKECEPHVLYYNARGDLSASIYESMFSSSNIITVCLGEEPYCPCSSLMKYLI